MSHYLIGIDEAGTGAWAGPAAFGMFIAPKAWVPPAKLRDSKKLSPHQRDVLYDQLRDSKSTLHNEMLISVDEIEKKGPRRAVVDTINHHLRQIENGMLGARDTYTIVIDGTYKIGEEVDVAHLKRCTHDGTLPPASSVPKADDTFHCVSAASVLAKVYRDRYMVELGLIYPAFSFAQHKGYGTPEHALELRANKPSPHHRRNYKPVKEIINGNHK